jgi:hypothetical protein
LKAGLERSCSTAAEVLETALQKEIKTRFKRVRNASASQRLCTDPQAWFDQMRALG